MQPVPLGRRLAAEALGTFCLVFAGTGAVVVDRVAGGPIGHGGIAAAFGLVVAAMIFALGHISGAHLNPAVTAAFAVGRHFPVREVGPYCAAQVAGALAASVALRAMFGLQGWAGRHASGARRPGRCAGARARADVRSRDRHPRRRHRHADAGIACSRGDRDDDRAGGARARADHRGLDEPGPGHSGRRSSARTSSIFGCTWRVRRSARSPAPRSTRSSAPVRAAAGRTRARARRSRRGAPGRRAGTAPLRTEDEESDFAAARGRLTREEPNHVRVERLAHRRLRALLRPQARTPMTSPSVLFLCVHNAGRSQMAAGWLRHLAGESVKVFSGGSEPAESLNRGAVAAMAEVGIDIAAESPQLWSDETVRAAEVVVTMGCGDACPFYPGKRYVDWELDDPAGKSVEEIRPIRNEIERRVRALMAELGVEPKL